MKIYEVHELQAILPNVTEAILVDFSWLVHRSYHAYKDLQATIVNQHDVVAIVPTGDIYGTVQTIITLTKSKPGAAVILVVDSPDCWKKEENPEYKQGRVKTEGVFDKFWEILSLACIIPSVVVAGSSREEADDVMFTLAKRLSPHLDAVWVQTEDMDLLQSLQFDNVKVFSKIEGGKFLFKDSSYVINRFGVEPRKLSLFRSFRGDKSDNLKGYPRIPSALIVSICNMFVTPEAVLKANDDYWCTDLFPKGWAKWMRKVRDNSSILKNNFKLMNLVDLPVVSFFRVVGDWEIFTKYQMKRLRSRMKSLMRIAEKYTEKQI